MSSVTKSGEKLSCRRIYIALIFYIYFHVFSLNHANLAIF